MTKYTNALYPDKINALVANDGSLNIKEVDGKFYIEGFEPEPKCWNYIFDEASYDEQLANPDSALSRYYKAFPEEDMDPNDPRGHSWAAAQAAPTVSGKSRWPWIAIDFYLGNDGQRYTGPVKIFYDGELKFEDNAENWSLEMVTVPDDDGLGLPEYRCGEGHPEAFDQSKCIVELG